LRAAKIGILFLYRHPLSTFVKSDMEILKKHFAVYPICIGFDFVKMMRNLIRALTRASIIYVWFAGFQAFISVFLAKLFGKKLVIVAGGYDAAYVPEIDYGVFTCWWRTIMAIFTYKNADLIIAVSRYTKKELLQHVIPKKVVVVYNGIDTEKFRPFGNKQNFVLTVGAVNWSNLRKKGLENFVKVAKLLPEVRFVLVGRHDDSSIDYLKMIATKNVEFAGPVSFNKLLELYRRAGVYVQISYHESFGVALAEAMACECVPVVTDRAALPEVVGECGIYVHYGDINATAVAIKKAFEQKELGRCARKRIVNMFSLGKREEKLVKLLISLIN
jgi:glycosyltransferase involved in cell wall biosynthesis